MPCNFRSARPLAHAASISGHDTATGQLDGHGFSPHTVRPAV